LANSTLYVVETYDTIRHRIEELTQSHYGTLIPISVYDVSNYVTLDDLE